MPRSLSATAESLAGQSAMQSLRFSLSTVASGVDGLLRPVFTGPQGWTLTALNADGDEARVKRQGQRLIDANTDLPWVPIAYRATGPDGMQYLLNAQGQIEKVTLADGDQWLVSDAGITQVAQANATNAARIEFIRNEQGGIDRIVASGTSNNQDTLAYRYDSAGRLILSRAIGTPAESAQQYGYAGDGSLLNLATRDGTVVANFGSAVAWQAVQGVGGVQTASNVNTWTGNLTATPSYLAFNVRESELASTVKVPGATGAVILALSLEGATDGTAVSALGATVLARTYKAPGAGWGGGYVYTLRTTEAGLKYIKLSGTDGQAVTATLNVAGDLNRDGSINGSDSAAFEAAMQGGDNTADLNGDGMVNATDRQMLYANYGWRANQAPVAAESLPIVKTHTDLSTTKALDGAARDIEGDAYFWRVLGATHGTARLSDDGQSVLFAPEAGYSGPATITLQADDGFAASSPIELAVNVSGAKLVAIRIDRLATLGTGQYNPLQVTGDFEDEAGVSLSADYLTFTSTNSAVVEVNADGRVFGVDDGYAVVRASARGIEGVNVFGVNKSSPVTADEFENEIDVFPPSFVLPLESGQRQIDVHTLVEAGKRTPISKASMGTAYWVSDSSVVEVSPDGLVRAKGVGTATVTVTHRGLQGMLVIRVEATRTGTVPISRELGGAVGDGVGNTLTIGANTLDSDSVASIRTLDVAELATPLPLQDQLNVLSAIEVDLGGAEASTPVQLAVRIADQVNPATGLREPLRAGTEVMFWREGTIRLADGSEQPTWWLVDNGVVGDDGLARTSSPPYNGIKIGGRLVATSMKSIIDNTDSTGELQLEGRAVDWNAVFFNLGSAAIPMAGLTGLRSGLGLGIGAIFLLQQAETNLIAVRYSIAGAYQTSIPSQAFRGPDPMSAFPAAPVPEGDVTPSITGFSFDPETREVTLKGNNFIPARQPSANFAVRVLLQPRGRQLERPSPSGAAADRGLVWQAFTVNPSGDTVRFTLPAGVAITQHVLSIERAAMGIDGEGRTVAGLAVESEAIELWSEPSKSTLVTEANAIHLFVGAGPATNQTDTDPPNSAPIGLQFTIFEDERGMPINVARGGTHTIAFSDDGTLAFVASANRGVYVVDTRVRRIVHTVSVGASIMGGRISGMTSDRDWLYIALTADRTGSGGLMRLNINPYRTGYLKQQQFFNMPNNGTSLGYRSVAVNGSSYLAATTVSGEVHGVDLHQISDTGLVKAGATVVVSRTNYKRSDLGKEPVYVTSARGPGEFIVSNRKDRDNGLGVIKLQAGDNGQLSSNVTTVESLSLRARLDTRTVSKRFHQDILSAADAVVVEYKGEEYALVADKNFWFQDAIAPTDGSVPDYQIGGKVGVIKNPFSRNNSAAEYLGATTPIAGAAIERLSIGADGKLYASVWHYMTNYDFFAPMTHSLLTWDAAKLVQAAINANTPEIKAALTARNILPESQPIDRHRKFGTANAFGDQIKEVTAARYKGPTEGTEFSWIWGIGSYRTPGIPIALSDTTVELPRLEKNEFEPPIVKRKTYNEMLNPDNTKLGRIVLAVADALLTGGYTSRYDARVEQYNAGKLSHRNFVNANYADVMATAFATRVAFTSAGVVSKFSVNATGMRRILGNAASGLVAGLSFDAILQAGMQQIYFITNGQTGQKDFSLGQFLFSGAIGAALGAALEPFVTALFKAIGTFVGAVDKLVSKVRKRQPDDDITIPIGDDAPRGDASAALGDRNVPQLNAGSEIVMNGRVILRTQQAESQYASAAEKWYLSVQNKLPEIVDTRLSPEAQAKQAVQILTLARQAAMRSLIDQDLAASFAAVHTIETIERLIQAAAAKGLSGKKLWEHVVSSLSNTGKVRFPNQAGGCFVAGTPVWTDKGLVPIDQLRVGDMVLSQPEAGGPQAYKRVVNTFKHLNKNVRRVSYTGDVDGRDLYEQLIVTDNHPFWVPHIGWISPEHIVDETEACFLRADGREISLDFNDVIYRTGQLNLGYVRNGEDSFNGHMIDLANWKLEDRVLGESEALQDIIYGDNPRIYTDVYNIEVEDFHTYYVGKIGIWVHNVDCEKLEIMPSASGEAPPARVPRFGSLGEVLNALRAGKLDNEPYALIPSKADPLSPNAVTGSGRNWVIFEDGVVGRIWSPTTKERFEYAVPYKNGSGGRDAMKFEGHYLSNGYHVFVDRKLSLNFVWSQQAGGQKALERLLNSAQMLEQKASHRIVWEFPTQVDAASVQRFLKQLLKDDFGGIAFRDQTRNWAVNEAQTAAYMPKIQQMLREGRFEVRVADKNVRVNQRVSVEGLSNEDTSTLTQEAIALLLPRAIDLWVAAGVPRSRLEAARFSIRDLPVGQAGGWYVDASGGQSGDFAQDSTPTSFLAVPGSSAYSRLDLLTVLVHELGHIAGLPSIDTASDAMSLVLSPGQRRLPSSLDVQMLNERNGPFASVPGTWGSEVEPPVGWSGTLVVNPTLANGTLDTATSWITRGAVDFSPVDEVILREGIVDVSGNVVGSNQHAQLSQAFTLSAEDQYLAFTVDERGLKSNAGNSGGNTAANSADGIAGPQDAFEVALLNANTGQAVIGTAGINGGDAIISRQLVGAGNSTIQARDGAAVHKVLNADGTTTYYLNLRHGVGTGSNTGLAGTPVVLSFDLIGFAGAGGDADEHGASANNTSQISIRDVRLVKNAVTFDDAAVVDEDGSVTLDVAANDLRGTDALGNPAGALEIVGNPSHGSLTANADGTFTYLPDSNFYGEDSFTYRIVGTGANSGDALGH
jgi:hypothetical protein